MKMAIQILGKYLICSDNLDTISALKELSFLRERVTDKSNILSYIPSFIYVKSYDLSFVILHTENITNGYVVE